MRRPGALVHHVPSDFSEDSDYFKDFDDKWEVNVPSDINMRHYDLGDGVKVGIGSHNDTFNRQDSHESYEDDEEEEHETFGQKLKKFGQGFFMNKETEIKREQFNLKTPFIQLINGFHAKEHIRLVGKQTGSRWSINFCRGKERMLHISSRMDQRCIVRNNLRHGRWMEEERDGGQPIKKSQTFTMDLICNTRGDRVVIFVNGKRFNEFEIRESLEQTEFLEITSGLELHMLGLYDEDE